MSSSNVLSDWKPIFSGSIQSYVQMAGGVLRSKGRAEIQLNNYHQRNIISMPFAVGIIPDAIGRMPNF